MLIKKNYDLEVKMNFYDDPLVIGVQFKIILNINFLNVKRSALLSSL